LNYLEGFWMGLDHASMVGQAAVPAVQAVSRYP
jgi:hypothetical protein